MEIVAVFTLLMVVIMLTIMLRRALDYLHSHPELKTESVPVTYDRCQLTLQHVIQRYQQIEQQITPDTMITWQSPGGYYYIVNGAGVQQQRAPLVYRLSWDDIGGVGVRMQPGFKFYELDRAGSADTAQTIGYSFHLLIVPLSGSTIDIQIPTIGQVDAIDFVAHTIAWARRKERRVNVFGFNKPPAERRRVDW